MTTGRNFDEVLRVLDSLQLLTKHKVATPTNWKPGDDVIIAGSVSDEEARKMYPQGWKAPLPYLRLMRIPSREITNRSNAVHDCCAAHPADPSRCSAICWKLLMKSWSRASISPLSMSNTQPCRRSFFWLSAWATEG